MIVSQLMDPEVVAIDAGESAATAARMMQSANLGCLPVLRGGALTGMLTDRDLVLRCIAAGLDPEKTPVGRIMSPQPVTVSPAADSLEAARLMADRQLRRLAVTENGRLVGMLSLGDLAAVPDCEMEASQALSEISLNVRRR